MEHTTIYNPTLLAICGKGQLKVYKIKEIFIMSKKIYLSPSNQANNIYADGNTNEMVQCNKISEFAKIALERCGFIVKKAPQGQNINTSIKENNSWGADLHIPIHTNAFNGQTLGGTLVMIYSSATENKKAGESILNAVAPISPGPDYSLRANPGLAELNGTKAIAVYLEVEFHDNTTGANWIINNVKSIGEAICKGVCNYYGIAYKSDESEGSNKLYRVQIGAFKDKSNAENCLQKAKNAGFTDVFIKEVQS